MAPDITSPTNERIKWLVRLRERRNRDAEGVFVVEGSRLYDRAIEAGLRPQITFTSTAGYADFDGEVITVEPAVLDKASYRSRSEGLIAVFPQNEIGLDRIDVQPSPLILIAENIEKPGNLGAMMRTAAAAGADALLAVGRTVDPFNPNAIRASTGASFSMPWAVCMWDEAGLWLTEREIELVAASPEGGVPLWQADLTGPVAIVIGAEDAGLSPEAEAAAGQLVAIPQTGAVDSLNASVAAALVLFEAVRQRAS